MLHLSVRQVLVSKAVSIKCIFYFYFFFWACTKCTRFTVNLCQKYIAVNLLIFLCVKCYVFISIFKFEKVTVKITLNCILMLC